MFSLSGHGELELELELILSHMTQKPVLRGEVGALRCACGQSREEDGHAQVCKALG